MRRALVALVALWTLAGCGTQQGSSWPTNTVPPSNAAHFGQTYRLMDADGTAADLTVTGIRYHPDGTGPGAMGAAGLSVTLTGRSAAPYKIDTSTMFGIYASNGPADPYNVANGDNDSNVLGPGGIDMDPTLFGPLLQDQSLANGQTVHGIVWFDLVPSCDPAWLLRVYDATPNATDGTGTSDLYVYLLPCK